jgi:topoisomerase-4 subunit A
MALIKCRTVDPVIVLDSKGRAYTLEAGQLPPARGDGAPASSLVEVQDGAHILYCLSGKPETKVLVATTAGYGFLSSVGDMISSRKAGREFMTVDEGHTPLAPFIYQEGKGLYVAVLSENARLLLFAIEELKALAKGRGTIIMGLDEGEKLAAVAISNKQTLTVTGVAARTGKEKSITIAGEKLAHHVLKRARMGRVLPEKLKMPLGISVA